MSLTLLKEKIDIKSKLLQYPHDLLSHVSEDILDTEDFKDSLEAVRDFVADSNSGASGLALPQIGILKRAFVAQVLMKIKGKKQLLTEVFINPKIKIMSKKSNTAREGCLSLKDLKVLVKRPTSIFVSYKDIDGIQRNAVLEGFSARVVLHEFDHLNGVVITDIGQVVEEELEEEKIV